MIRQILRFVPLLLLLSACGPSLPRPQGAPGGPAPAAAVERFLHLVQDKDYVEMGWVFGTAEGPVIQQNPLPEVEKWMYALSAVLEHQGYSLANERTVPGRIGAAVQFDVTLQQRNRSYLVPFTAVRGPGGRWFVEQIDIEAITNPQRDRRRR